MIFEGFGKFLEVVKMTTNDIWSFEKFTVDPKMHSEELFLFGWHSNPFNLCRFKAKTKHLTQRPWDSLSTIFSMFWEDCMGGECDKYKNEWTRLSAINVSWRDLNSPAVIKEVWNSWI